MPFISKLGRFDYILEGIDTSIYSEIISLIKKQLEEDLNSDNPSLLAKWLPSHRIHKTNSIVARKIMSGLNMSEKEYRKTLANLRKKLNIIERNLTERNYDNIDFNKVPTKAILKYRYAYYDNMTIKYEEYKSKVREGKAKVNTEGLFVYEVVKDLVLGHDVDSDLYDLMWTKQKDLLKDVNSNILVMADTSGSMTCCGGLPLATSIGLALYTAERNKGIFKNHFVTFSEKPYLCEVKGKNLKEKIENIPCYVANTDINKAFQLVLNTAVENKIKKDEMPSHILIISDMEFDAGVYSKRGTNFSGWKKNFEDKGFKLPKIVFWNVAAYTNGVPATKFDNDVALISGFSTNILENIFSIENYNPVEVMLEKLDKYLKMLKN